jgi:hypothetical protein
MTVSYDRKIFTTAAHGDSFERVYLIVLSLTPTGVDVLKLFGLTFFWKLDRSKATSFFMLTRFIIKKQVILQ